MRLTLRTLLAYLDDILEPAETKEIGRKIQESPVAQVLISRIKEVMRRRRLGAPEVEGPGMGMDPNLVAQYLDNTLPPEQVGEVEKVFLESDQQLAEVAACHQILTIALGEPVEISRRCRERLYVLGPVEAGEKLQTPETTYRGNGEPRRPPAEPLSKVVPAAASPSFDESLPDYLKPRPWSGKILTVAGIVLLAVVWIATWVKDPELRESLMRMRPIPPTPPAAPAEPTQVEEEAPPAAEVAAETPKTAPELKPDLPVEDSTVAKAAEESKPVESVEKEEAPPADVAVAVPSPEPAIAPPAAEEAPRVRPEMTVKAVSPEGILLTFHPQEKRWYVVPRLSEQKLGTRLACPEPFESVLDFENGTFRVTLLGGTVVELLKPTTNQPTGLRLVSGRMILQSNRKEASPVELGLVVGPRSGVLSWERGETLCGISYLLGEPTGYEQPVPPTSRLEGMYVLSGKVVWQAEGEPSRSAHQGQYLALLADQPPLDFGTTVGSTPEWLDPQRRKVGSALRRFASQFEREFELNEPIDSSMLALIRDSRPKISELAVRCLGLTENVTALVQALAQADHEEVRKAAAEGLRQWLGVSVSRGEALRQALARYYEREEEIVTLYRLLWGISEAEARDPHASLEIVEWLRSNRVEIRELTFANLVRLTGRRYDYRPLSSTAQREPAVKRWLEHVQREGGLVKSE